jgi:multicomponent Na+:H+ antiporter subunit G
MSEIVGGILIAVGLLFNVLGCVGLIRLPDVYNRLQAATKCVTLGTCLVLAGVVVIAAGEAAPVVTKALLCMVFIIVTSPTAAHALARGAHASGVRLWENSVIDRYEEDREPGIASEETP